MSVVVPLLDEEDNVPGLIGRFDEIRMLYPGYDFEFVTVDDGSTDDTVRVLKKHVESRDDLKVLVLSRNFGAHYAVSAGLADATGDAVIFVGADLQEPPELIGEFIEQWQEGSDIVWGVRTARADQTRWRKALSTAFARLLVRFSELKSYPIEGPAGFLMTRQVSHVIRGMQERHRNIMGLMAWSGFTQSRVEYQQRERSFGRSKWSLASKLKLAVDSFVQFSFAPVRFMTYTGLLVAMVGFLYALALIVRRIFWAPTIEGWTTVVVVTLIVGGLQLVMLGVLGEYLWRTADEARTRPLYIIKDRLLPESDGDDLAAGRTDVPR